MLEYVQETQKREAIYPILVYHNGVLAVELEEVLNWGWGRGGLFHW